MRRARRVLHPAFSLTVDVDRALLYAVFAGPEPDVFYGGERATARSVSRTPSSRSTRAPATVAGIFKPCITISGTTILLAPPALLDVGDRTASARPILAQPGRAGYLYILDRVTGEPLFDIVEPPVPASDVPGERASPTQPIPRQTAAARARAPTHAEDIVTAADTTAEHAAFCRALRDRSGGLQNCGPFTPYRHRAPERRAALDDRVPGLARRRELGRHRRRSGSRSRLRQHEQRGRHRLARAEHRRCDVGADGRRARAPSVCRTGARALSAGRSRASGRTMHRPTRRAMSRAANAAAWPCQKPPWGELLAVNAATGDVAWRVPLGLTEQLPESRRRTGRLNSAGRSRRRPGSCSSARATIGGSARSIRGRAPSSGSRSCRCRPMPCRSRMPRADGRQYVAIVAAGRLAIDDAGAADAQSLIAYALP